MHPLLLFAVLGLAACGADRAPGETLADAGGDAAPPDAEPDAAVCAATSAEVATVTLASTTRTPLVLDGIGSRCEQLARAILDPSQRPPELAALDAQSGVGPPLCIEYPALDAVRIDIHELMGRRLLSGGQSLLAWVDRATDTVVELTGSYLVPPAAAPIACTADATLRDAVIGHEQPYTRFQLCAATGDGVWTVSEGDVRELGDAGWFHDGARLLAAREISVGVAEGAITQELRDSDLNCCAVIDEQAGCIGIVLIVDAESGKVLGTRPRCVVC